MIQGLTKVFADGSRWPLVGCLKSCDKSQNWGKAKKSTYLSKIEITVIYQFMYRNCCKVYTKFLMQPILIAILIMSEK